MARDREESEWREREKKREESVCVGVCEGEMKEESSKQR